MTACDDCLRRTDLIGAIAGRLQIEFKQRTAPGRVLALPDDELLAIGASDAVTRRYASFDASAARTRAAAVRLTTVCRCRDEYPERLRDLADPPAVLHVLGDPRALGDTDGVGVVGARRASAYGLDVARVLGRGLSAADVTVISGLALGIDSAAHAGALEGHGRTVGVLAGSANVAYPTRGHRLHAAVAERGAVISELPPGASAHRWCFVARNRIIAALSAATVVVQATERSGSLTTADFANELGRAVGAVPGQVTTRLSGGTHSLILAGAPLIRHTADVLELLAGATGRVFGEADTRAPTPPLEPRLALLLSAIEQGHGTLSELAETAEEARFALSGLGELERLGLVRRGFAGRWERAAA
ncbi:DNA-processing protein DprA [Solirubrobacter phytolaccae]|uniref:DNA-processing protein DprA n=1 Tax=Solirubrobacter phytolaccae TaxID=1404360 RepID=A0A9X3SC70_9ACTN|nr:DNA-processing protein DprA [Solirubrobacter phytolaccae]MDA0185493.1 DNA-processing protein DprA [Solirubrobacter phytolaccae]